MNRGDFWSRRKAAVAKEARSIERDVKERGEAETEAQLSEVSDEELLAEMNLPVPEDVTDADQVKEFLASALPQRLKTRALRQLWKLNPVLANLDGLIDYGEDFTDKATVIEGLQTAYQVGKGMLSHVEALAAEKEPEDEVLAADPDVEDDILAEDEDPRAENVEDVDAPATELAVLGEHQDEIVDAYADEAPHETVPTRRRMQFQFEMQA